MAHRSIGSVTISLGLVTIPVKYYTAHASKNVSFNRLERKTGAKTKQLIVSAVNGKPLNAEDIIAGYEYTPDKFVTFEADELKSLELEGEPDRLRILGVVPASSVDPTHITKSVFLGPDKGAERGYTLLAALLAQRSYVAIAQCGGRTRDEVSIISPHGSGDELGLVVHDCLYLDEVRHGTLAEVRGKDVVLSPDEIDLGLAILDSLARPSFLTAIAGAVDNAGARLKVVVDTKVAGKQVVQPPPRTEGGPIDLLEQLRASAPPRGPKKARATAPASRLQTKRTRKAG